MLMIRMPPNLNHVGVLNQRNVHDFNSKIFTMSYRYITKKKKASPTL